MKCGYGLGYGVGRERIPTCLSTTRSPAHKGRGMMRKRRFNKKARAPLESPSLSPIVQVREFPPLAPLLLFVRAGGHCEFDSCNRYLIQHHLTLTEGNFAEVAHIVAFRPDGPRGRERGSSP